MLSRRRVVLSLLGGACLVGPARAQAPSPAEFIPEHPLYAECLGSLTQARWAELVGAVSAQPPQSAYTLLTDLGVGSPLAVDLKPLARATNGAGVAGAITVGRAWRFRGSNEEIADEGKFGRELVVAAEFLTRALDRDPGDGVAATFLMKVLKGAGETKALHDLLPAYLSARRRPVEGLAAYADAVSAKWVGSEAEALDFARRYADSAPAASFGLIPDVHFTTAVARTMSDDPAVVRTATDYFSQPAVVAEVVSAHEKFGSAPADTDPFASYLAHAQFSLVFLQLNDAPRARQHLAAQGAYAGGPWRAIPNARAVIARARTALGLSRT